MAKSPTKIPSKLMPLAEEPAAPHAIDESTAALASGRRKPKRTGRKATLTLIGLAIAGAGVALAANENLRNQVLSSAKALGEEIAGDPEADEARI